MADERKRIINLPAATELSSGMNFVEDSSDGTGTRRVTYETLQKAINQTGAENLAAAYDNTDTYDVGDLCTHEGVLYVCSTQISAAESWTAAHWTRINLGNEVKQLNAELIEAYPLNTITGSSVTIEDAIEAPLESMVVSYGVTQDEHGAFTAYSEITVDTHESGNDNLLDIENDTVTISANVDQLVTIVSSITLSAGTYTLQRNQLNSISSSTKNTFWIYEVGGGALFSSDTTTGNNAGVHYLTFTLSESKSIKIYLWVHTASAEVSFNNFMLEEGGTPSAYRPYGYTPITATLAESVYKGVTDLVSGTTTVYYKAVTFDGSSDETWTLGANGLFFVNTSVSSKIVKNTSWTTLIGAYCNLFDETTHYQSNVGTVGFSVNMGGWIAICPTGEVMTVDSFMTWLQSNNVTIVYPLADAETISSTANTIETVEGENYFETSDGTLTVQYRGTPRNNLSTINVSKIAKSVIIVDAEGNGDYTTMQEAIDACTDIDSDDELTGTHCTILVMPGTYERFSMGDGGNTGVPLRSISIIGVDRKTCIVRDDTGLYNYPPAEIRTNGTISNMTFYATHDDGDEDTTLSKDQYAVHIDFGACDMRFENCDFISYSNCAVGMGLAQDMTVEFDNCHFENRGDGTWGRLTNGAFYCHTKNASDITGQVLTLKNCEAISENGTIGALFQVLSTGSSEMELNLYNNMFWSGSGATATVQSGWDTDKSFGNNITLS